MSQKWQLPPGWLWKPLGDESVCEIIMGQSPPGNTYNGDGNGLPFFQGKTDFGETYPTVRKWCTDPRKVSVPGDVLISVRAPVGPTNLTETKCIIGRGLAGLRPGEYIQTRYLLYTIRNIEPAIASRGTGSTFKNISKTSLSEVEVPIPFPDEPERSLDVQRRIVARIEALLAEVREMRKLHAEITADTNELLQAARREVLGGQPGPDWIPLSKYVKFIENGRSPQARNRPAEGQEWGVLKVGAVTYGYFKDDENKALLPNTEPRTEFEVKQGDFLMSRANTLEWVGACALVKEPPPPRLLLSDKIFRFHFRDKTSVNPVYLDHVLKSPPLRSQIEKVASGTSPTMKNISKAKVLNLLVPEHTPKEQEQIATHLELISGEVGEMKQINEGDEELLLKVEQAILNKAFRGEL